MGGIDGRDRRVRHGPEPACRPVAAKGVILAEQIAIPAATLILLRESRDGRAPNLLMVERTADMAFAAGATVFPGGRIDPGDHALAARIDPDEPDMAARIAAIRETIEEVGIAVGLVPQPGASVVAAIRARLAAGRDFADLISGAGCTIDGAALLPFARWRPDMPVARIFDTHFFIARAPRDAVAIADGHETLNPVWASAATFLADADSGRRRIIFPTRRNLERLAVFASFAEVADQARRIPAATVVPWVEDRPGGAMLCIPHGYGYPITEEALDAARRQ